MKLKDKQHLTYCLNVHPGETWDENFKAIKESTLKIRDVIEPDKPFGLGLRISSQAVAELSKNDRILEFKSFLEENNLYVFTVNAFPYGTFHKECVKENVYMPDWRCDERQNYTTRVADILAKIIFKGESASISTVPCSYKSWIKTDNDVSEMVARLMNTVAHFAKLEEKTERLIHLGLEPEPDCYLETTDDVITFFKGAIIQKGIPYLASKMEITENKAQALIARHLGICFDTCHIALQFEDLEESVNRIKDAGILISKAQISSAICMQNTVAARKELLDVFCDPVYLHQIKTKHKGIIESYTDIEPAIQQTTPDSSKWRIHFHVPLYFKQYGVLTSTSNELTPRFFEAIKDIPHIEIETYSFDVLPPDIRSIGVIKSVVAEYQWVLEITDNF